MKITQLSVFAENKPGRVVAPCRCLADAGVEIRALSLAETARFGVLRMIVDHPARAAQLLEAAGFVVKATAVLAVKVSGGANGLAKALAAIEGLGLNAEYMYAFPFDQGGQAVLIFQFEDLDAAIVRMQGAGVQLVARKELQAD
jgi:hypothetical protein